MNGNRLPNILHQEIRKNIGQVLSAFSTLAPDERQRMEAQGQTLAELITAQIIPLVEQTRVGSVLFIMEEGIGNMVMATPALRKLKATFPSLHITVWGKEPAVQVVRGWSCVDKVITEFDNSFYDLAYYTIWSAQTRNQYEEIVKNHCHLRLDASLSSYHESVQHYAVCDFMGGTSNLLEPHCQTETIELPSEKYIILGDTTLRNFGWEKKRWPYYEELAKKITKKFPEYSIVFIGDEEDKKRYEETTWPDKVDLSYVGTTSIPQLAYLIKHAEKYIGNDTGPTHIAGAVGTETYALFGPTLICKNKPLGEKVQILSKRVPCSPCQWTERWDSCSEDPCIAYPTADEVYNSVFFPDNYTPKFKTLLVGEFSGGALRNEVYIKKTLEKEFKHKVIPFAYRDVIKQTKDKNRASNELLNAIVHNEPDLVLICGGQELVPQALLNVPVLSPKTKVFNWYVDQRGGIEQWFVDLCAVCDVSFWSTGDPNMLSQVFGRLQNPTKFLPIVPDETMYFPTEVEKDIDVLFVGTPHSKPRIDLLDYLIKQGINVEIYGNGEWPPSMKSRTHPGVFNKDFNDVLNRSKIVINTNIINNVPLYFSDRYFYPMATKTVGLNQRVPLIEDMFEEGKHMLFFNTPEECVDSIKLLLSTDNLRKTISEEGYKLYKEKYTLKLILEQMLGEL